MMAENCIVHQYGLFKFKTGNDSRPATPNPTSRSRAHTFSLDAISRNLFNAIPGSSKGDFFGGSLSSHRRSKSSASRSSVYTQTTTSGSQRSGSTTTAATSLADDDSFCVSKSSSLRRKLVGRGRSPGEGSSPLSRSAPSSRNSSREPPCSDGEDGDRAPIRHDQSDKDLSMRLELARRNSQNQHGKQVMTPSLDRPIEDTIYEGKSKSSMKFSWTSSIKYRASTSVFATHVPSLNSQGCNQSAINNSPFCVSIS